MPPSPAFLPAVALRRRPPPLPVPSPACAARLAPRIPAMSLRGRTVAVTGATRGIGRGLALALAEQGAHLVITGRTPAGPTSLAQTAADVVAAGGTCDTYVLDHADDAAVARWFDDMVRALAKSGRTLDVFVNNAYAAVPFIMNNLDVPFWRKEAPAPAQPRRDAGDDEQMRAQLPADDPGAVWDIVNSVGLRANYVNAVHATRAMLGHPGVIINITSWASLLSLFDVVYSVGKVGNDRMSAELNRATPANIRCFSFCPGAVATEAILRRIEQDRERASREKRPADLGSLEWNIETPLFVGRALAALLSDPALLEQVAGKVVVAAEVADRFAIEDENGGRALSFRSLRFGLCNTFPQLQTSPLRMLIPRRAYIPWIFMQRFLGALQYWG